MNIDQNLFQVLNEDDLDEILEDNNDILTVILFSAKWCGPCRKTKPSYIKFSKENKKSFFVYINIDTYSDNKFNYMSNVNNIPHFEFYYQKNLLDFLKIIILIILFLCIMNYILILQIKD